MNVDSEQRSQASIELHSRSFALAARLLPAEVRSDVKKLYAWCRACDDAVDQASTPELAQERLDLLRADVERIYQGLQPSLEESFWLAELVERYHFPQHWPLDLLAGMESDINFDRFESVAELEQYCYRAAGVVGLMMSRVLGVQEPRALQYANSLGMAMQMTNIARDVAEDYRRGRCYLPKTWLETTEWKSGEGQQALATAVKRLLEHAELHYRRGASGYSFLPPKVRLAIRVAARVYREIGEVIRRSEYRVTDRRNYVTGIKKFCLLIQELASETAERSKPTKVVRDTVFSMEKISMRAETLYLACFGLSLSLVMATAMFAMVGLNPKLESYQQLPWLYSLLSGFGAILLGWFSRHLSRQLDRPIT